MNNIKYFFQFIIIIIFFLIFKIIGLKFSSFLSGKIFNLIGPLFRSNKISNQNLRIWRFASLPPLTALTAHGAPHIMAPHSSLSRAPLCSLTHPFSHHTPWVTDEKQPSGSPPFQNLRICTPPEAKGIICCVAAVIAAFSHSYSTNWLPVIIKNETTSHSSPTHP